MNRRVVALFTKYYYDCCSQDELDEVFDILRKGEYAEEWSSMLRQEAQLLEHDTSEVEMSQKEVHMLKSRILRSLKRVSVIGGEQGNNVWRWRRIVRAASILFFAMGVGYFYSHMAGRNNPSATAVKQDMSPGKKAATLTLGNGQKILLNDASKGELARESGVEIIKAEDGQIIYKSTGKAQDANTTNTLSTQRGETCQLTLPDGTKVWLNAASSLTYAPAMGVNHTLRKVKLDGEAYFEVVKKSKSRFVVESKLQEVTVLGTHFNISSYNDEETVRTTLLEGKVEVKRGELTNSVILKPNQLAIVKDSEGIKVQYTDVETIIAWKNNEFRFEEQTIEDVMKTISRWYDVEVIYLNGKPAEKIIGTISRSHNLSTVLQFLSSLGGVDFKVEGRKVYIS
ncbi:MULTISPECIES: FecR family protein [unclassified Sphingobacterium]|uniref:FecR family protein n=1 Tax=unclassified Sphingobacterium TaxID=2609468 RepID=UPI0010461B8F|nr:MULTISPECIES: FecR domain-containing protein [unclassified Sphingobacterium]MCS3556144.1 hypothetical protein [Sphingobacterium sp. JUb21]TCR08520.1 FecR family protein [Sphingobacterium sp. JUb20]